MNFVYLAFITSLARVMPWMIIWNEIGPVLFLEN